jgi:hypothetical protein
VAGLEPSRIVEEATKTVDATVAGLDGSRRRDEATISRAHAFQESAVRTPSSTILPDHASLPDPERQPTLTIRDAGALLGIRIKVCYELARRGEFPVPILRLGSYYRVPTRPLLDLLGLLDEPESGETSERTGPIAAAQDQDTRQSA